MVFLPPSFSGIVGSRVSSGPSCQDPCPSEEAIVLQVVLEDDISSGIKEYEFEREQEGGYNGGLGGLKMGGINYVIIILKIKYIYLILKIKYIYLKNKMRNCQVFK